MLAESARDIRTGCAASRAFGSCRRKFVPFGSDQEELYANMLQPSGMIVARESARDIG